MENSRPWITRLQLILTIVGIAVAGYLTYVKLFAIEPYCAGVGNCEAVQTSPYAELMGIPVAIWGLFTYIVLLGMVLVKRADWRDLGHLAGMAVFLVTMVGVIFSAYLTYLELFVIHAICPWCVASAVVMTLLFVLSVIEMFFSGQTGTEPEPA
ncbi:MAG: vitamin K epoxide reductase family protein [Caldilineae bacterium]|nr:vitamin K epoxide reductase family protein [Anaerolineae bacterium]MCB9154644.1 vitamin K epoxide reductase family protein [Caldilineae bacterium]